MTEPAPGRLRPTDITLRTAEKTLVVEFADGARFELPAELLRVESPSAEVQGHGPHQKKVVAGRRGVSILAVEPVGNYAVRLRFSDRHDTGLFTWAYLRELGEHKDDKWQAYLAALDDAGLTRDP